MPRDPLSPALDVSDVEPEVGHAQSEEVAAEQLLHVGAETLGDGARLVLGEPVHAHLLGDPLHLAGEHPSRMHLGHGGDESAVHPLVALDHAVREEATAP